MQLRKIPSHPPLLIRDNRRMSDGTYWVHSVFLCCSWQKSKHWLPFESWLSILQGSAQISVWSLALSHLPRRIESEYFIDPWGKLFFVTVLHYKQQGLFVLFWFFLGGGGGCLCVSRIIWRLRNLVVNQSDNKGSGSRVWIAAVYIHYSVIQAACQQTCQFNSVLLI